MSARLGLLRRSSLGRLWMVAVVVLLGAGCDASETYLLVINNHELQVEVVDTPEGRERGLMDRSQLDADHGMLFVFEREERRSFWMKNTLIPLSIAYIGGDLIIDEILQMTPHSTAPVPSRLPAMYALELNAGRFAELGIRPGHRLVLSDQLRERIAR